MPVRGLSKVKCVVRLYVLAHNLMRMAALAPQLIGWGTGTSVKPATLAMAGYREVGNDPKRPKTALAPTFNLNLAS